MTTTPESTAVEANRLRAERIKRNEQYKKESDAKNAHWWAMLWARFKYWGWTIGSKSPIAIVYFVIVPNGLIHRFPDMGKKLGKVPFFSFLDAFESTYKITVAQVFSIIPLVATMVLWSLLLSMYLAPDRFKERFKRFGSDQNRTVILIVGIIVILADAGLFASGFSMSSWGASGFSASAVLATALYCAVFAFVSLVSLYLGDEVTILKEKEKENSSVKDPQNPH